MSLALDAGNGVGGPIILKILKKTGKKFTPFIVNQTDLFQIMYQTQCFRGT
jgi:phosphomannomutase